MKKMIGFATDMNMENVEILIERIEEAAGSGRYDEIEIHYSTQGGTMLSAYMLSDFLNQFEFNITFVLNEFVMSAGLYTVLRHMGNIKIGESCYAMAHIPSTYLDYRESQQRAGVSTVMNKSLDASAEEMISLLQSSGVSEDDLEKLKNGLDVYFDAQQLANMVDTIGMKDRLEALEAEIEGTKMLVEAKIQEKKEIEKALEELHPKPKKKTKKTKVKKEDK